MSREKKRTLQCRFVVLMPRKTGPQEFGKQTYVLEKKWLLLFFSSEALCISADVTRKVDSLDESGLYRRRIIHSSCIGTSRNWVTAGRLFVGGRCVGLIKTSADGRSCTSVNLLDSALVLAGFIRSSF